MTEIDEFRYWLGEHPCSSVTVLGEAYRQREAVLGRLAAAFMTHVEGILNSTAADAEKLHALAEAEADDIIAIDEVHDAFVAWFDRRRALVS